MKEKSLRHDHVCVPLPTGRWGLRRRSRGAALPIAPRTGPIGPARGVRGVRGVRGPDAADPSLRWGLRGGPSRSLV